MPDAFQIIEPAQARTALLVLTFWLAVFAPVVR